MIDNVLVEIPPIENTGAFTLNLNRKIEIHISASEARHKVNHYVLMEISSIKIFEEIKKQCHRTCYPFHVYNNGLKLIACLHVHKWC